MNRSLLTFMLMMLACTARAAEPVALESLTPTAIEWGTTVFHEDKTTTDQPKQNNAGAFYDNQGWWGDAKKIVAKLPDEADVPADKPYMSRWETIFKVAGEPTTGVGLWARGPAMYHWVEYDVPAGTERIQGKVYYSDDVSGYTRGYRGSTNQNGTFQVLTGDNQPLLNKDFLRVGVADGSGEKLMDLDLKLDPETKKIRFRITHTPWGDGNNNTELVLSGVKFVPPAAE